MDEEFWKHKTLGDMTDAEWESLCDGCALCCLHKLEDEESGEIFFTDVSCKLLDTSTCRCTDYKARATKVKSCLVLKADEPDVFAWLPGTCAYRLLADGKELPEWHPLLTGDPDSVHDAGISAMGKATSETITSEWTVLRKFEN